MTADALTPVISGTTPIVIDDPAVVRRILEHLGRWAPEPRRAGPARSSARLAAECRHPTQLSPGSRYRVAQCEGQVRPYLPLAPCDRPTRHRIRAILTKPALRSAPHTGATSYGHDARQIQMRSKPQPSTRRAKRGRIEFLIVFSETTAGTRVPTGMRI
jgi:hypothetical protein